MESISGEIEPSKKVDYDKRLENQLTNEKLTKLEKIFEDADEDGGGGLDMDEFRTAMRLAMGEHFTDEELDLLFMKVDTNCDGTVDWDEYLSYMLLEYREKDTMNFMVKEKPLPRDMKSVENMNQFQRHHDSIVKIVLFPNITKDHQAIYRVTDSTSGRYVSTSKEGVLNFWSMDLRHQRTQRFTSNVPAVGRERSDVWVTEMVCMWNFNMLAVATTAATITFYELHAGCTIYKSLKITELEIFATAMDYWVDPQNTRHAILLWGDARGNISALQFEKSAIASVLHPHLYKHGKNTLTFQHIFNGNISGLSAYKLTNIHLDFVLQIRYCPSLGCFLSCCRDSNTSLFMGDLTQKRKAYFRVNKGTLTFDYSPSNNVIVTGGKDAVVRVWNPYVPRKPVMLLHGHKSAIVCVVVNERKEQVISISDQKDIFIFDLSTQTCIQSIFKKWVNLGPRPITASFFNEGRQALIMATNQLAIWEHVEKEQLSQSVTSHTHPITTVLYNSLFKQVVSGSADSLVCVWDTVSGARIIQFVAHRKVVNGEEIDSEISVMTFDPTLRRLLTGAQDGSVKIWNFNNGACLRELQTFDKLEITGIVCPRQQIITAGWNQRLTVYMDSRERNETVYQWAIRHKEDILTLAFYPPSTIASASFDGDILIWSLETGYVTTQFNVNRGIEPFAGMKYAARVEAQSLVGRTPRCSDVGSALPEAENVNKDSLNQEKVDNSLSCTDQSLLLDEFATRQPHLVSRPEPQEPTSRRQSMQDRRQSLLPPPPPSSFSSPTVDIPTRKRFTKKGSAVEKLLFLESRKNTRSSATLVASSAGGWLRAWSIHPKGGLLGQWNAAQKQGESVLALSTDRHNEYLITGDSLGYIKVWDISDYCVEHPREPDETAIHLGQRKRKFPFLSINRKLRQQAVDQTKHNCPPSSSKPADTWRVPCVLTSFRGHLKAVTEISYVDSREMIVSASSDCSIRMWTIAGAFIGIFGQNIPWRNVAAEPDVLTDDVTEQEEPGPTEGTPTVVTSLDSSQANMAPLASAVAARKQKVQDKHLPSDVRRVASATTLKMFHSGRSPLRRLARNVVMIMVPMLLHRKSMAEPEVKASLPGIDGTLPRVASTIDYDTVRPSVSQSDVLGCSYRPNRRHQKLPSINNPRVFKNQYAVYSSLRYHDLVTVQTDVKTPQTILDIRDRQRAAMEPAMATRPDCGATTRCRRRRRSQQASSVRLGEGDMGWMMKSNRRRNLLPGSTLRKPQFGDGAQPNMAPQSTENEGTTLPTNPTSNSDSG